jgi:hypothetical protein
MYAFTFLMFMAMGTPSFVFRFVDGRPSPTVQWVSTVAGFALLALFGFLAHRDYKVARAAIASDPTLRGRWLTENAWWLGYVALVLPFFLWLAFGFARVWANFG